MGSKRQAFPQDGFQQGGFTLVELVGVIVLLGILSIMALPRFINLSADAHSATLQNLMGTLRSTITMVNIGCQLTPDCLDAEWGAIVYIPAVNKHVRMLNGYPDGGDPNRSDEIDDLVDAPDFILSSTSHTTVRWSIPDRTNCYVEYTQVVNTPGAKPTLTMVDTGC